MSSNSGDAKPSFPFAWRWLLAAASTLVASACQPETHIAAPEWRPVRGVTVERREVGVPVTLTGRIEAEDEVALGFRIAGRILENGL
jgi:multidrug efflux pump subunit AcrA (membrane-fusion protein)